MASQSRWRRQTTYWLLLFVGLAAVAFLSVRFGRNLVQENRATQLQITARDVIYEQLRGLASNRAVLQMATRIDGEWQGNQELRACLDVDGSMCRITKPEQQIGFVLKDAIGTEGKIMAGDETSPGLYSTRGKIACDPLTDEGCPGWLARIWFWADCPDKATECDQAEAVHVRFQVLPAPGHEKLAAHPPADAFTRYLDSFSYGVRIAPRQANP